MLRYSMPILAAALLLAAQPSNATELRETGSGGKGVCYSDGTPGCRPLRAANHGPHVFYGPYVTMYPTTRPVYVVNQGPEMGAPGPDTVVYGRAWPNAYYGGGYYGGAFQFQGSRVHRGGHVHRGHHMHGPRSGIRVVRGGGPRVGGGRYVGGAPRVGGGGRRR